MRIFSIIRSFTLALAAMLLVSLAPPLAGQAWGASLTIPSGSTLNVNTGTLTVPGNITNAGTLQTSSGTIMLTGNWVNSGTFTSNTGTVTFNATSGTQTLNTGGVANAFYNLTHNAASTVQLTTNVIDINNNFSNTAGTFDANSLNMTVGKNWTNSATFTPGTNTVTLDGSSQSISGTTTFYNLTKQPIAAADTLTLADTTASAAGQTITNTLTLKGSSGNLLSLRSSTNLTYAKISLQAGGSQALQYLDVKDSDASGGLLLVAGATSTDTGPQSNLNWSFGSATMTWDGSASTDWDDPFNWDIGLVPGSTDTAVIPSAPSNQPTLSTAVSIANLTINSGATVTLNGKNLTVSTTLTNSGNVKLKGSETLTLTQDTTNTGTFTYLGAGGGSGSPITIRDFGTTDYYHLVINATSSSDVFITNGALYAKGNLTITSGTLDISTNSNALTVDGTLTVDGGTLTATNSTAIDANGAVTISTPGVLTAPSSAGTFTVAGDWTHSTGTFTHSSGTVTFDTTATATITGDTTFYNLTSTAAGKQINFTAGSNQTVSNTLSLLGTRASAITLRSTSSGSKWSIGFPNGAQTVNALNVMDSNALTNTVTCLNCTDAGNNNTNWIFSNLLITAPTDVRTVGRTPTLIGLAVASSNITIKDISDNIVATARSDANGNFRVVTGVDQDTDGATTVSAGTQLALGANALTPYLGVVPGLQNSLTVVASPTTSQVPTITSPINNQKINGSKPTMVGQGQASQTVTVVANDAAGVLLLTDVGTGTVAADGSYSVTLTTALPKSTNYLSVTVDGVASDLITVTLTDPFGVVFDSTTNRLVKNATVSMYMSSSGQLARAGVELAATDTNPYTTGTDGFYSFLAADGNYYMVVAATGYTYPSQLTTFPSGRTVITGSKGETFTVGTAVIEMDHPLDANGFLLRIEKDANKNEARIGDVVTYTVKIENLSSDNAVNNVVLDDRIPPGFKYLSNRVLLDGVPLTEPSGQRPLLFSIGTVPAGATMTLRYQLIIGSGVMAGPYENRAVARYSNGLIISNYATETVKVVLDPLFDLGTVIGKVFYDLNDNGVQDAPEYDVTEGETIIEKPVPNVQIVTEDGTVITTDREGKFSLPGLLPGRHILRVNERTLPPGTFLTTDKALLVDITPGLIVKANFGVNIDNEQVVGKDAQFFNEQIRLTQDANKPVPRLNAALFDPSSDQGVVEAVPMYDSAFLNQVEFRIFTNYASFIDSWRLDILDKDTKKLVKRFEGTRLNIYDPLFWNGRGDDDRIIRTDRKYSYALTVTDSKGAHDTTVEKPFDLRIITDEAEYLKEIDKQKDKDVLAARAENHRKWVEAQNAVNNTQRQTILLQGETLKIDRQGQNIKSVRVLKDGALFAEFPVGQGQGLTPKDLLSGFRQQDHPDHLEMVLPNGDYVLEVVGPKVPVNMSTSLPGAPVQVSVPAPPAAGPLGLERYTRKVKVGDDYFMFVALGDAKVGYTFNTGNVEPVQSNDQFQEGFWKQGKGAYYLKGKVKGKYLVTSSFDTDRAQKELFRKLDPNTYYPIYGDKSTINYDATDTKGPLYLLVEWDKSSAIWGNYALDFKDTEFAAFSRTFYGGKIDYQSLAVNPYGDARTKVLVFHAEIQQRPSHNEFLGTGGSLYFLKHKDIIQGSDKVRLEVRDRVTGLSVGSKVMKNGADYELDEGEGRILFWQPVSMIVKAESIVSDGLLEGNPVYVVTDYEYAIKDKLTESSAGGRVAQAVGDNVVLGGTYVKETQADKNYELKGADVTVHLGPDATVKAERAQTQASGTSSFVSTDGGITFSTLSTGNLETGLAYGIKGDARLFGRLGLSSYYKWFDNDFATTDSSSRQGKESAGMALTFDLTPVTRLTARQDIQRLIQSGNLQTQAQVGASETSTIMAQIVHEAQRLKLTGEYQLTQVKEKKDGFETATNQERAVVAGKAEYALTDRIDLSLTQQIDIKDASKAVTTAGVQARLTDKLTLRGQEAFSKEGTATSAGLTANVTDKLALSSDYTIANMKTGEVDKAMTIGAEQKVNDNIFASGSVAVTDSSTGNKTTTGSLGTKMKLSDVTSLEAAIGQTRAGGGQAKNVASLQATTQMDKDSTLSGAYQVSSDAAQGQTKSLIVGASRKVDDKTSSSSKIQVDENAVGGKITTLSFADATKINDQLQAVSERTFGIGTTGLQQSSKYSIIRDKDGKKLEGSLTRQLSQDQTAVTQSNIFGLSGDVNDRVALQGSIEKGRVQNLDGTSTNRTAFTLGTGYVLKDVETAVERLTNSTKIELRLDNGVENKRQFVFYNALEGKLTDNLSASVKLQYDKTQNMTTGKTEARHKEIILGAAYRPVNFDRLNLITQYTYKENVSPSAQVNAATTDVTASRAQVLSGEAVYDVDENWQLAEKFALRINEEKVTGFEFNKTHTWLMIHRINYRVDRNWQLSGEYRRLTQEEAQDSKQGFLLEAARNINDNAQLGIGWNFTNFSDDLTALSYTSQGPFLRMTGKMYDRTPQEKARARAKWLDDRVTEWSWIMVKKELAKPGSKVTAELNNMFVLAKQAQKADRYEESKQIYKDIIMAGQMMFDEASQYIRSKIAFEEKLQEYDKTAREYLKGGEYIKARKLWEKIVEDAQKRMIQ
ncbi:MAG: DUF11 domain-containing protein [Candidatus Omnitrophica bacterium]|nr:DUF11 domain-containing protein [Candidatus Omnitrophota bacterium]